MEKVTNWNTSMEDNVLSNTRICSKNKGLTLSVPINAKTSIVTICIGQLSPISSGNIEIP